MTKSEEKIAAEKAAEKQLRAVISTLFVKWFVLKSDAFREEKEVRLISYFFRTLEEGANFRATRNCIIPYREFELHERERTPIVRVFLGPKQRTPVVDVEYFLKINGFHNVEVLRSAAPYR